MKCCLVLDAFDCPRLTKESSSKYLGIYLGFYDESAKKTRYFLLHFDVLHDGTNPAVRERVRAVMAEWGILEFYDAKKLPIVGDCPMAAAFSDFFAVTCNSHTISNILKR